LILNKTENVTINPISRVDCHMFHGWLYSGIFRTFCYDDL